MVYRTRINYSAKQKTEIWDRWQRGESLNSIGRAFDRPSSSIFVQLVPTGGIRPPTRRRSRLAMFFVSILFISLMRKRQYKLLKI